MDIIERIKQFYRSLRKYPKESAFKYNPGAGLKNGVCAAIAYRLKIPVCIIRFVLLGIWFFVHPYVGIPMLIIYIVLCIVLPEEDAPADYRQVCDLKLPGNFFRFDGEGQVMGGLCSSIAYRMRVPAFAIRLGMFLLMIVFVFFLKTMLVFWVYLVIWMLLPAREVPEDFFEVCRVQRRPDQQAPPTTEETHQTGEKTVEETPDVPEVEETVEDTPKTPEVEDTPEDKMRSKMHGAKGEFAKEPVETTTPEEVTEKETTTPKRPRKKRTTRKKTTSRKKK